VRHSLCQTLQHRLQDLDECQAPAGQACAKENKFCINTEGTFRCMACDKVNTQPNGFLWIISIQISLQQ
jgi:hypothetical protein